MDEQRSFKAFVSTGLFVDSYDNNSFFKAKHTTYRLIYKNIYAMRVSSAREDPYSSHITYRSNETRPLTQLKQLVHGYVKTENLKGTPRNDPINNFYRSVARLRRIRPFRSPKRVLITFPVYLVKSSIA